MMTKFKQYILLLLLACAGAKGYAQSASPSILLTLDKMYKNYDSIPYLSFDVAFDYSSDTLSGKYASEHLDGKYTMAGKKTRYTLGDIDFMQNESYFIAVYNTDKFMLVDEPKMINSGSQLPMRQQMDSLLRAYANQYTITTSSKGSDTGMINMVRIDSTAQFNRFSIMYDTRSNMLCQLYYEYPEADEPDPAALTVPVIRKKRLTISFLNYRYDNYEDEIYNESNYIFFENGVCKPAQKYEGFKVYNSKPVIVNMPPPAN